MHSVSLAQSYEPGPSWRRNLGSPSHVTRARAPPAGEGSPRQALGVEATGA